MHRDAVDRWCILVIYQVLLGPSACPSAIIEPIMDLNTPTPLAPPPEPLSPVSSGGALWVHRRREQAAAKWVLFPKIHLQIPIPIPIPVPIPILFLIQRSLQVTLALGLLSWPLTPCWAQSPEQARPQAPVLANAPPASSLRLGAYVWPTAQSLDYTLALKTHGLTLHASATMGWQTQGSRYQAHLEMRLPWVGSRSQHSSGLLSEAGVEPLSFTDKQRKALSVSVDREHATIELADHAGRVPLQKEHQDALSVYFELAGLLGGMSPPYPTGQTLTLPVFMAQTTENWPFKLLGPESLSSPMGEIKTLRVERLKRSPSDTQHVELWLAPSLGFLPARILIEEANGERIDQRIDAKNP